MEIEMKLTYKQFHAQLVGARACDEQRWTRLNMEAALWEQFAFDDVGARWLGVQQRQRSTSDNDWLRAELKAMSKPGYFCPTAMVIQ